MARVKRSTVDTALESEYPNKVFWNKNDTKATETPYIVHRQVDRRREYAFGNTAQIETPVFQIDVYTATDKNDDIETVADTITSVLEALGLRLMGEGDTYEDQDNHNVTSLRFEVLTGV